MPDLHSLLSPSQVPDGTRRFSSHHPPPPLSQQHRVPVVASATIAANVTAKLHKASARIRLARTSLCTSGSAFSPPPRSRLRARVRARRWATAPQWPTLRMVTRCKRRCSRRRRWRAVRARLTLDPHLPSASPRKREVRVAVPERGEEPPGGRGSRLTSRSTIIGR